LKSLRQGGALAAIVVVCAYALASARMIQAQGTLPSGWLDVSVGESRGSSQSSSGTFIVSGSGENIWDSQDAFRFAYRTVSGDFDITARLDRFEGSDVYAKAGVMIRETLDPGSRNAFMLYSPAIGHAFQVRTTAGGATTRVDGGGGRMPTWLRLAREGTRVTAYRSADGQSWTEVSSLTMNLPASVFVGLAVNSHTTRAEAQATFSNVAVAGDPGSTDGGTDGDGGGSASPWTSADVGSPRRAGSSSESGGTYTVTGAGAVLKTFDQFHFFYQPIQGDTEIIARVSSLQGSHQWAKAGVMIRESMSAQSRHAFMVVSRSNGSGFQRRIATGGESYHTAGPSGTAPGWVRLTREGALFTAYYSADGSSWRLVGTETISMGATVYVGLAVTSHDEYATATATITNVTVRTPSNSSNQPPTVSLTSPSSGETFTAPATVSMAATAADSTGSIARVDFYRGSTLVRTDTTSPYTATWSDAPAGTYQLRAVATDNEGETATSATVTVTVADGGGNRAPTVSFTSPQTGTTFAAPATIPYLVSATDSDGQIVLVRLYQGSTLLKEDMTSPYSHDWTGVPAGTYQLRAVAYDDGGATSEASVSVTVNPAGSNQAPTVSIATPTPGASFTAPATVNIEATASDPDGTVTRVDFYRGSTVMHSDSTSPYTAVWTNAPAGSYTLTARAYDDRGATRTSTAVNITISTSANQPPTVAITAPASGSAYTAPASIAVTATASDPDGTIANVDFYAGSQLIGSDSVAPYTAAWNNVGAGTYSLTAVARDNAGGTRTSTAVSVTVATTPPRTTTVVFAASADHDANVTSYTVAIYRTVDPITGTPVATRDLGKPTPSNGEISVDISTLINPLATGSYYAVVRAIGPGGTTASAASATFSK
jgi:regulation of enolase protein 1 (concanavalin A-like superfamily)